SVESNATLQPVDSKNSLGVNPESAQKVVSAVLAEPKTLDNPDDPSKLSSISQSEFSVVAAFASDIDSQLHESLKRKLSDDDENNLFQDDTMFLSNEMAKEGSDDPLSSTEVSSSIT